MLSLENIVKRFGGVTALGGASLVVRPGTIHAVLGENGAGKTTLVRVAYGMVRPDAGVVRVDGRAVIFATPREALRAGVGMVQQHFAIVRAMTVAENVALGGATHATGAGRWRYDARTAAERVRAIGRETGLTLEPEARAGDLPVGAQQRLEIVKALARDARTLILDEPTAVLTPAESEELLRWLRAFAHGERAVVMITHKLREALAHADDITVLRRGETVATFRAADANEGTLAAAMLGGGPAAARPDEAVRGAAPRDAVALNAAVIHARGISVRDERGVLRVRSASLYVAAGEIVGIAAVEGAGQRELLRALAGRLAIAGGALELPPRVGFVPEDRQRDALIADFTVRENLALRGAGRRRGLVRWQAVEDETARLLSDYDVRGAGTRTPARALSGGNQQKLVLARELDGSPEALVVENPSRGLDIRASAAVHARLRAARDAGTAVVLHSADLDEVLALSDRVLAMHAGELTVAAAGRDALGRAMLGL